MDESLKLGLVEQYVDGQEIVAILPQARWRFLLLSAKYGWVAIIGAFIRDIIGWVVSQLQWLVIIMGLALFGKYLYDFVDAYLDTVVLTNKGITIVRIDNWFKYKIDFFERKSIMAVSHSQSGLMDKLFDQWTIQISLDHDSDYHILWIASPGKQAGIINKLKFTVLERQRALELEDATKHHQPDKFELLVDTLSEVIWTYMAHK